MKFIDSKSIFSGMVILTILLLFSLLANSQDDQLNYKQFGPFSIALLEDWSFSQSESTDELFVFRNREMKLSLKKTSYKQDINKAIIDISNNLRTSGEFIEQRRPSAALSFLGLTQSQLLTIKSRSTGTRRFVFLPVVDGNMYEIVVTDPKAGIDPSNNAMYFIALIYLTGDPAGAQSALAAAGKWKQSGGARQDVVATPEDDQLSQYKKVKTDYINPPVVDSNVADKRDKSTTESFKLPEAPEIPPYNSEKGTIPLVKFSATDPCAPDNEVGGLPWESSTLTGGDRLPKGVDVIVPPILPDFENLSKFNYRAAVSLAFEGMRLVYGPMPNDEVEKFEAAWAPLFDYPTQEIIEYMNRLNPLLSKFLACREAYTRNLNDLHVILLDAAMAVEDDDRYAWEAIMAEAGLYSETLQALLETLNNLALQIESLGNPPNPVEAKCGARRRYENMLAQDECFSSLDGEWVGFSEGHDYLEFGKIQPLHLVIYSMPLNNPFSKNLLCTTNGFYQTDHTFAYDSLWVKKEILATDWIAPVKEFILTEALEKGLSTDKNSIRYIEKTIANDQEYTIRVYLKRVTGSLPPPDRGTDSYRVQELIAIIHSLDSIIANAPSYYDRNPVTDESDKKIIWRESPEYNELTLKRRSCVESLEKLAHYLEARPLIHAAAQIWLKNLPLELNSITQNSRIEAFTKIVQAIVAGSLPDKPELSNETPSSSDKKDKTSEEEAKKEAIAFHTEMINIIKTNMDRDIADLNAATKALSMAKTPAEAKNQAERIKELNLRVIHHQSNIQIEEDRITSTKTGQIVRTRTAFDDYAYQLFIDKIRENGARIDATRRIADRIERQVKLLPIEIRAATRERLRKRLDPKAVASGDIETVRKVANQITAMVQGDAEYDHAIAKEAEVNSEQNEFYAQMTIMAAGACLTGFGTAALADAFGAQAAITIYGSKTLGAIYGGITGYLTNGPKEGVVQALSYWSPYGYAATQFVDGFQRAGYQQDASMSDQVWEGVKQAGTAYIMGKAFEYGAGLVAKGGLVMFGKDSRLFKPIVQTPSQRSRQMLDGMRTQQHKLNAKDEVRTFQRLESELALLKRDPVANQARIAEMEKQLNQLSAGLNASYHAKWELKYKADPLTRSKFDRRVQQNYSEMTPGMKRRLEQQGYNMDGIEFVQFRNASSGGTSSMDLDLGPVVKGTGAEPGVNMFTKKMVIKKDGSVVPLEQFMDDAQRAMNAEYRQLTGMSARASDMNLVTSVHPEAFSSPRLLDKNLDFSTLTPEEISSVGKVLEVKMEGINRNQMMTNTTKMQAKAREASKEIENMLLKKLQSDLQNAPAGSPQQKQLQSDIKYWEDMLRRLKQMGTEESNPMKLIELNREISHETGGRDANGVINDLINRFK